MKFFSDYTRFIIFFVVILLLVSKTATKATKLWENQKNQ